MGVLKKLTTEYFGDTERLEDRVVMDGVIRVDFTDKNGKRHRNGYRIVDGDHDTLKKFIQKLVYKRGPECELNDGDVSNVTDMNSMFYGSLFNGGISGWDVSNVVNMRGMFCGSYFNGDISGWEVNPKCDIEKMFNNSPLESNPPEWYKNRMK